jgi:hypothetical protein
MMKVAELQQMMMGLVQPVRAAGAGDKVCAELQRAAQCLEPFKENTLAEFNDFLVKAQECVRTGQWPKPGGSRRMARDPNANGPAITVEQAAQRIMGLFERVNDPEMKDAAVDAELQPIAAMGKPELLRVTQEVGMSLSTRTTKEEIMQAIRRRVRGGKEGAEQGTPRPQPAHAGAPMGGGHPHHAPAGGMTNP